MQATDGNFYGTTSSGEQQLCVAVARSSKSPRRHTDHAAQLQRHLTDGYNLRQGWCKASDGNFYGTTSSGGATTMATVFKITPSGTLTTLYSFCSDLLTAPTLKQG